MKVLAAQTLSPGGATRCPASTRAAHAGAVAELRGTHEWWLRNTRSHSTPFDVLQRSDLLLHWLKSGIGIWLEDRNGSGVLLQR